MLENLLKDFWENIRYKLKEKYLADKSLTANEYYEYAKIYLNQLPIPLEIKESFKTTIIFKLEIGNGFYLKCEEYYNSGIKYINSLEFITKFNIAYTAYLNDLIIKYDYFILDLQKQVVGLKKEKELEEKRETIKDIIINTDLYTDEEISNFCRNLRKKL